MTGHGNDRSKLHYACPYRVQTVKLSKRTVPLWDALNMNPFSPSLTLIICAGLNVEVDRILEIACIITDGNLTQSIEVSLSHANLSPRMILGTMNIFLPQLFVFLFSDGSLFLSLGS